jgi:hypothetical protein
VTPVFPFANLPVIGQSARVSWQNTYDAIDAKNWVVAPTKELPVDDPSFGV